MSVKVKIVELCEEECTRFRNGEAMEYDGDVYERVGSYWNRLAMLPGNAKWQGYNGRSEVTASYGADGRAIGKPAANKNQPWSAAFVSWIMAEAGAGDAFPYSSAHSRYIVQALKAALKTDETAPLIGRRRSLYAPRLGDLIACERQPHTDPDFDTYPDAVKAGDFEAHCDFVVDISPGEKLLTTIGGNVGHSVRRKTWRIDDQGRLADKADPRDPRATVICIIENRIA